MTDPVPPSRPREGSLPGRPSREIADLLAIMERLRHPQDGCPWDLEQDFASIARYTIEEAYEVVDAIERGDLADLRDELGDLLLQVVFHARLAQERGVFAFPDVVEAVTAKLVRRHPHVFGEARHRGTADVNRVWEEIKRNETRERASRPPGPLADRPSVLDGVARAMPQLMRADRLSRKAAAVGFVWAELDEVAAKVEEELAEVREAAKAGDADAVADEVGDLLFTVANLARHLQIDPEAALARANAKFVRRFRAIEAALEAEGRSPYDASLADMEALWQRAKVEEGLRRP